MPDENGIPAPFDDLIDPRSEEQRDADARVRAEQVDWLGRSPDPDDRDWLVDELAARRKGAPPTVTRFEMVARVRGGHTLVAPREIVVRNGDDNLATAEQILTDAGFVRVDPTQDFREFELADLVTRYLGPEGSGIDLVTKTAEELRAKGLEAAPGLVTALHAPPKSTIVIKSLDGPHPVPESSAPPPRDAGSEPNRIKVAVIDTGIDATMRDDRWLNEVPRWSDNIDPLDVFPPPSNQYLDFAAGHGEFVAGVVRQVDPRAEIVLYRALDSDGIGSEYDVARAIRRAVVDRAQVINLSLGMRTVDDAPPVAIRAVLDEIAGMSEDRRPVVVASAGNYGTTDRVWPAAFAELVDVVVAVAGLTAERPGPVPSAWSSHGSWVTCSTVAEGIVSTFVRGKEDPLFGGKDTYPLPGDQDSWALWTGTSFAAPQIAGAISRRCRTPGTSPTQAKDGLLATGVKVVDYGRALRFLPGT